MNEDYSPIEYALERAIQEFKKSNLSMVLSYIRLAEREVRDLISEEDA